MTFRKTGMNPSSFRHLDFVKRTEIGRLCLSKPNGQPIYAYDNIEYDAMRSPIEVLEVVTTHCDASYLSSHYKRNHLHKRKHEFAGLCVVTTMTALYLLADERFVPFSCKDQVGIRHWWFVDIDDNETFDPTGTQYNKRELENLHRSGKPTPYYGWGQRPATRFLDLISGIQPTAVRYSTKAITN